MSKFNQHAVANAVQEYEELTGVDLGKSTKSLPSTYTRKETVNLAGGQAFTLSPEMGLYTQVCTMGMSNKFYKSESDQMKGLIDLIGKCDPEYVAKLAVYVRKKMYLRSIPLVMVVELAKTRPGGQLISRMIQHVIGRADEITELLAYYQVANERTGDTKKLAKLSNQIKKGIREIFESGKFDEYQFSKYNRPTEVKLRDALFLTHPKPQDKAQEVLFGKIAADELSTPDTWEANLSNAGQDGSSKKQVWESMIAHEKLGYMAMIRNIRNFLKEGVGPTHIKMVCEFIADRDKVLKSKQLPFRFLAAYRTLIDAPKKWLREGDTIISDYIANSLYRDQLIASLETAISYSVENLPMFGGDSLLCATDVSGSMMTGVSPKSSIQMYDIGALLCMIAKKSSLNSVAGIFGNEFKTIDTGNDVLRNVQEIYKREGEVGYSTNGFKVLEWAINHQQGFDRIMMFTDCQMYDNSRGSNHYDSLWKRYHKLYPNSKLYLFDLHGYGTTPVQIKDNGVYLLSGWSDKVFDILHRIEKGESAIDEINSIVL